jgi:hypothetical protein
VIEIGTRSSGGSECIRCSQGRYSRGNSASCLECEQGDTQPSEGQSECQQCQPGERAIGTVSCARCTVGRFSTQPGSMSCSQCGNGTYQPSEGQKSCLECPAGTNSPSYLSPHVVYRCHVIRYSVLGLLIG